MATTRIAFSTSAGMPTQTPLDRSFKSVRECFDRQRDQELQAIHSAQLHPVEWNNAGTFFCIFLCVSVCGGIVYGYVKLFEKQSTGWTIFGVISLVILFIIFVFGVYYCCCNKK